MLEMLDIPEGRQAEDVIREFNHGLAVPVWQVPAGEPPEEQPVAPEDEGAPWWWNGAEEASQSFLLGQGVAL